MPLEPFWRHFLFPGVPGCGFHMKNKHEHFQIPLMFAFRDAFEKGDARTKLDMRVGGERVVSGRGSLRRRGADEALLKKDLALDLLSLVNTIDLSSVVDLEGLERVKQSVLNFGLQDVTRLTSEDDGVFSIGDNLITALRQHEPRLYQDSLTVDREGSFDDVEQRIRFNVAAEMSCRPFDVPVEFVAEVDVGAGKLQLTRLPIAT
jgi:type VI secretion system protein ImpF